MSRQTLLLSAVGVAVALGLGFAAGRLTSHPAAPASSPAPASARKVLYWYDPMVPNERYPGPGKSSMNMDLIPKYADETAEAGVHIDPARVQNLGVRTATVERAALPSGVTAAGILDFNDRDVAVVQAKAAGFVQRVYGRAPGDVVGAGAPLADILVPEWAGAQGEFLAMRRTGDEALTRAARQRLQLVGMPPSLIAAVERSGRVRNVVTVSTPTGGVIKTLSVRNGMTVAAGATLAEINGLARVWLNASVPEALSDEIRVGETATATLAAFPGRTFNGRVTAVLPQAQAETRTLTARIELPNPGGRLRPGMFASVRFGGTLQPALLVPSEAVIRTGKRTLVMLAKPDGRYAPTEVRTGREADGRTEVLAGLSEGETVVASGQFLIDSEASLAGLRPRPLAQGAADAHAGHAGHAAPQVFEGAGRVEAITAATITISHGAIPAAQWPAMTMTFRLPDPAMGKGFRVGDRVGFAFDEPPEGPTVRRLTPAGAR
ncbi:efflux RND transporter periplasmic adaptor subunit [Phenylobacterium soli]|uniref:Efflux RND transporter periplasmic adaptor subunit n=1 Tax=Phenylobacterium soli TaxID=2170551 RepID=A0A328AGU1_9CAUL|nr:efflux RND transporter periplasmic adaptor subunit [Phenylobacterium soli]RAK54093.1 efflux RND transporter periplasmic adaptor subunit [Phenylobacterium soli]